MRYSCLVIQGFADARTRKVWDRERVPKFASTLQRAAHRKLLLLNAAGALEDLRVPPGNRLEKLKGDRSGQHSVRIDSQWRICFIWTPAGPRDVEIVEYP